MSNETTKSEKCTESNEQPDEPTVHELGGVRHAEVDADLRVRLTGKNATAEFAFELPAEARAFAEAILPDGYAVVQDGGPRR